jgi:hypothetical protein
MTIRRRLSIAAALAVAVSVALASLIAYLAVQKSLRAEVDSSLEDRAQETQDFLAANPSASNRPRVPSRVPEARFGGAVGYVQMISTQGTPRSLSRSDQTKLPVSYEARAVAVGSRSAAVLEDRTVDGDHLRILTAPLELSSPRSSAARSPGPRWHR